jgi:hypothetical protein
MILEQIENSQVFTTLKFWTNIMLFSLNFALLPILKGNNYCKFIILESKLEMC